MKGIEPAGLPPNIRHFCRVAARIAQRAKTLPLSRAGLAALVEHGVRSSGRQGKLTTRFADVGDVVREADYWASRVPAREIGAEHVLQAVARMAERNVAESRIRSHRPEGPQNRREGEAGRPRNGISVSTRLLQVRKAR